MADRDRLNTPTTLTWRRWLVRLVALISSLLILVFAVSNRHQVRISLEPFSPYEFYPPLFGVFFAGLFVGIAASAFFTAWSRLKRIVRTRKAERRADKLSRELNRLEQSLDGSDGATPAQIGGS